MQFNKKNRRIDQVHKWELKENGYLKNVIDKTMIELENQNSPQSSDIKPIKTTYAVANIITYVSR